MADNFSFPLSKYKMFAFKMSLRTPGTLLKKNNFWFGPYYTIIWLFLALGGPFSQKLYTNFVLLFIVKLLQECINDLSKDGFKLIAIRPLFTRSKRSELAIFTILTHFDSFWLFVGLFSQKLFSNFFLFDNGASTGEY